MFAAAIFASWWVLKVGVRRLVIIATVGMTLFSIPLWVYGDIKALPILAFLWSFANLSMLKMTLSFATQMVEIPTPRLVSALLLGATIGTGLSPIITSQIVAATDNYFILQFSTICYVALHDLLRRIGGLAHHCNAHIQVEAYGRVQSQWVILVK